MFTRCNSQLHHENNIFNNNHINGNETKLLLNNRNGCFDKNSNKIDKREIIIMDSLKHTTTVDAVNRMANW